jgi:hypothetical protein
LEDVGDAEVWATICLNTAFAGAFRVLLPACKGVVYVPVALLVAATARKGVVYECALIGGVLVTAALPVWTAFQLLFDPEGRLWMDRVANVQVLDCR